MNRLQNAVLVEVLVSLEDSDQEVYGQAVRELKTMGLIYIDMGENLKAAEWFQLAESIQKRLDKFTALAQRHSDPADNSNNLES